MHTVIVLEAFAVVGHHNDDGIIAERLLLGTQEFPDVAIDVKDGLSWFVPGRGLRTEIKASLSG